MLKFGLIAADTSRTRIYLNALHLAGQRPFMVVVLPPENGMTIPGMLQSDQGGQFLDDPEWPEAKIDLRADLIESLDSFGFSYVMMASGDINDPAVVEFITDSEMQLFVYSGYGGSILRPPILSAGKTFLHVHGGYLPAYRGSTTNYYSILKERRIGASSIFLSQVIDQGPILHRQNFRVPEQTEKIDHFYDSAVRARVLVNTLIKLSDRGLDGIVVEEQQRAAGDTYYIIHPVLKHIAIMKYLDE